MNQKLQITISNEFTAPVLSFSLQSHRSWDWLYSNVRLQLKEDFCWKWTAHSPHIYIIPCSLHDKAFSKESQSDTLKSELWSIEFWAKFDVSACEVHEVTFSPWNHYQESKSSKGMSADISQSGTRSRNGFSLLLFIQFSSLFLVHLQIGSSGANKSEIRGSPEVGGRGSA